jgi:hypothetical protein
MRSELSQAIQIDIVGSSTFGLYNNISVAKTYNMYISDNYLVNYIGYKKVLNLASATLTRSQGRGIFKSTRGNFIIAVINSNVYRINPRTGTQFIGEILTSTGSVYIDENLSGQICIVDGLNAYIYNRFNNALTVQNFAGAIIPNYVCYHNTYFLLGNADITGNGSKWVACSYATDNTITITYELALQTKPDYAKAIVRIPGKGNNVAVLGSTVGEIHTNVGGLLGYQRVSTMNLDFGVLNVATIATNDRYLGFLGINEKSAPRIIIFDGQTMNPVSTDGISNFISNLTAPQDSYAFFYETNNHDFYHITFYADDVSLIYDVTTGKFFHVSDYDMTYFPAKAIVYAQNKTYFLSHKNGGIYECGTNLYSYDENIPAKGSATYENAIDRMVQRVRVSSNFDMPQTDPVRSRRFVVEAMQGNDQKFTEIGYLAGGREQIFAEDGEPIFTEVDFEPIFMEGSEENLAHYVPNIAFSFSWDSGDNFGIESPRIINFVGKSRNIIEWTRLGMFNVFTAKIKFWGKCSWAVGQATLEVSK